MALFRLPVTTAKKPRAAAAPPKPVWGTADERARDAARKRAARAADRDVLIPELAPAQLARRDWLEARVEQWLYYYFPADFSLPFTPDQREMIQAILSAAEDGGDQAIAAPRGEGKSLIAERVALYCVLRGVVRFPIIFCATGTAAEEMLENLKEELTENDRLHEDYPAVCVPVRALQGAPARARAMTVSGAGYDRHLAAFHWMTRQIRLPRVPGSRAGGAVIATRGLDGEVRGRRVGSLRPDLAIIDDPDTEITSATELQADKLEKKIDRNIAGLAGQQRRIARVMLTTIQTRISVSARFTDPKQKPSWKGRRFSFLKQPPTRQDLWDEFCMLRQGDQQNGDEFARRAHQFYLDRRDEMDAGAELSNPRRFSARLLDDGTQEEVSALERYYNLVSDLGQEAVDCEYQNNPPELGGPEDAGLSAYRIQRQLSGYARKQIPPGCTNVEQGIDVGKRALHFVVRAFRADGTGYNLDYGVQETHGTTVGSDEGLDVAIISAIKARYEASQDLYTTVDGEILAPDLTLVDASYRTEAVYQACRELGLDCKPSMGFGKSSGCVQAKFTAPTRATRDKKPGDRWFLSRRPKGVWLVCFDADHWKNWEHDRWLTDPSRPGTMFNFGEPSGDPDHLSFDEKGHFSYGKHIVAEQEVEEVVRGVLIRHFKAKSDTNHYLDASVLADVAASMKGIRLRGGSATPADQPPAGGWFAAMDGRNPKKSKRSPKR